MGVGMGDGREKVKRAEGKGGSGKCNWCVK